ncbi:DUF397 domain-containing protein [Spirillospora sp. NPDC052269]
MSASPDPRITWRKSTHSSPDHSDCVEVADLGAARLVRDSKDPEGPRLAVPSAEWRTFTAVLKGRPSA